MNAANRGKWFGIVRLNEAGQPVSYLQMYPRANGVVLHKINLHSTVEVGYLWSGYFHPKDESVPYEGDNESLFLDQVTWYSYPHEDKHLRRNHSMGHVTMRFREDGYVKEEVVTSGDVENPDDVEFREFRGVDVSKNWFTIPEFGDWGHLFHPDGTVSEHLLG
ncbi:hypothetical protein HQQ80_07720 [Microbacteriaceae bacterium VKM Ac-2855]|nr:hypothetical protein [Microbacteriaceae bacterium VKM Ac-2855]